MLRLPWFEHRAPRSVAEAAAILAAEGPRAMLIAGGTNKVPVIAASLLGRIGKVLITDEKAAAGALKLIGKRR